MHYPQPGWVELDMDEVWRVTKECIHEALGSAGASPADVAGIGITNERETAVLWDRRTGRPVARSITWQDTRTAAAADALAADGGIHRFQHRTGLPISTASTALKLRWLLDQDPVSRSRHCRSNDQILLVSERCKAARTPDQNRTVGRSIHTPGAELPVTVRQLGPATPVSLARTTADAATTATATPPLCGTCSTRCSASSTTAYKPARPSTLRRPSVTPTKHPRMGLPLDS